MPRTEVLSRRTDLARLNRHGRRAAGSFLTLCAVPQLADATGRRVAFLLDRGIGRAVDRNLLKRRLREAYRLNKDRLPVGFDYAVRASASAACAEYHTLAAELMTLAQRIQHAG